MKHVNPFAKITVYAKDCIAKLLFATSLFIFFTLYTQTVTAGGPLGDVGDFAKWQKVEIEFTGPASSGTGDPNPFNIFVDVTFTAPSGKTYEVPGFYNGDGTGGMDGNLWKVRFSADETGTWNFSSQSSNVTLDGYSGTFNVTTVPGDADDFYRWGRLEYDATAGADVRYLKFRDGSYWLKAGSDDPENFLGSSSNYNTLAKRKAAIDYLASKGINSQYMITHNIDGDDKDVWPWYGTTPADAKLNGGSNARFDIAKLEEWNELFEHMQSKGVAVYIVLEDDSAWSGYDHGRYYRELIARFGYLPALLFNIGEEANENYSYSEALGLAQQIKDIDPYDHPISIHNVPLWPDTSPDNAYIDSPAVDFTSLQTKGTDPLIHNQIVVDWIARAKSRNKRIPMVNFDEARPILDRKAWWSAYLGGGVWEAHVDKPYDRPMSTWETIWQQLGGTRAFMETIPFWEMSPANSLVSSGTAFALAKAGEAYAFYLPSGGSITVSLQDGHTYQYAWWNPDNGQSGSFQNTGVTSGGVQTFDSPGSGDWALRILRSSGSSGGDTSSASGNVGSGTYPDLAIDSSGNIHIVYAHAGRLRYKKYDKATGEWSAEQDTGITQLSSYRNDPDIAVDSSGAPHVLGGEGNGTGQYAYWDGTAWIKSDIVLNRDTAIAIDRNDNVYIVERGGTSGGYVGIMRRDAGGTTFTTLTDPDNFGSLPLGRNDHVYGHVFTSPADDSVHVVYRHAAPDNTSIRSSNDMGSTWTGAGISNDDLEAPSGVAADDGTLYVITGNGTVFELASGTSSWSSLGRAVNATTRELPNLAIDQSHNLYAVSFGGIYNIYSSGAWAGQQSIPSTSGAPVGFVEVSCAESDCFAVWEEGTNVIAENDGLYDEFEIHLAQITPSGINTGGGDSLAPAAPTSLIVE